MKIAFIGQKGIPAVKGGGVEVYTEELATRLAKQGHEVFVYARKGYTGDFALRKTKASKYPTYNRVRVIYLPTVYNKNLETFVHSFLASFHALTIWGLDVIHYQGIGPSPLALIPRVLKPWVKTVSTFHSRDYMHKKWSHFAQWYLKFSERMTLTIPHETVTISRGLQSHAQREYGKEIEYIPQGLKTFNTTKLAQYLKPFGIKKNKYIVSVSRLVAHKGIHYLIDAYKQLPTSLKNEYKLVIVGSGNGSYTDAYEARIRKSAEEEPNIIFTGLQTGMSLRALYANAYLFVQPSEDEGLSISLLEALGAGTAALVSNIKENIEVVRDRKFQFKKTNTRDLKKRLEFLLEAPDFVKAEGRSMQNSVKTTYAWERLVKRYEELYHRVVQNKKYALAEKRA